MKRPTLIVALAVAMAMPLTAAAAEFNQVRTDQSSIAFGYKQMGVTGDGRFVKFAAQLAFDPVRPGNARTTLDVDLASIDTGIADVDKELAGRLWFDTRTYPTARFVSTGVRDLGGNRYEVSGKLSIKGRTQDIVAPVAFSAQGNRGVFDGAFTFKRADFAIGEGAWAKFDTVANEIQVKFQIVVLAAK